MRTVNELHEAAMEATDKAFLARRRGDAQASEGHFKKALELETTAAMQLFSSLNAEPSRSVLFRSAAMLALDVGDLDAAERLAGSGLASISAPEGVRRELWAVLDDVKFRRYLSSAGVELEQGEVKMVLLGNGVGHGVAYAPDVINRIDITDKILVRFAERRRRLPFRDSGRPKAEVREDVELYMEAQPAGSFVLNIKVGRKQLSLVADRQAMVRELLECLDAAARNDDDQLEKLIPRDAYRRNFKALFRRLGPDGERVSTVGFAANIDGEARMVALRGESKDQVPSRAPGTSEVRHAKFRGELRYADSTARRPTVKVVDDTGKSTTLLVPEGMMNDIVRPFFGERVVVSAHQPKRRSKWVLVEVASVDDD